MNVKLSALSIALGLAYASSALATPVNPGAYYEIEEVAINKTGDFEQANFGPYAVAISPNGTLAAGLTTRSSIEAIDYGLHFTYERECYYSNEICEVIYQGSNSAAQSSYENAIRKWRLDQTKAADNYYSSQFIPFTLGADLNPNRTNVFDNANTNSTDQVVTDISDSGETVGYGSATYSTGTPFSRDFTRHAFYKSATGEVCQLKPTTDLTRGGFSAAYNISEVTFANGETRKLVFGHASVNRPNDENIYLDRCFASTTDDDRNRYNELTYCPGFNTQPWVWDVTNGCDTGSLEGSAMVANPTEQWLDNRGGEKGMIYSAAGFSSDKQGVVVGFSSQRMNNSERGDRARAVYMTPNENGEYLANPVELTQVEMGVDDPNDNLRHTWATDINNNGLIIGNRVFELVKGRNRPTEFFIFDKAAQTAILPLADKNIRTKKERVEGTNSNKPGANSQASAINDSGLVVGWADAPGEVQPVESGNPRRQSAFVYDVSTQDAWYLNDLVCTKDAQGVVKLPYYRFEKAKDISDDGTILATGYRYDNKDDFINMVNAHPVLLKLTRNLSAGDINSQPSCYDSKEAEVIDKPFTRSGGNAFWLLLLGLPLLVLRKFTK
ncbi:DUF3466 family protein [Motilimonas sp. 1_MG-2023]|uniref:DUF3466 family protein n=1 Tax=Motilimonas sp. 1_MG-2023 TaxID=3062672 RepID=UPI0026E270DC|nr:DUF3466 family protein [Motilimonas sp. 1_MG-2023]MDO6527907.1 DUF3466 family protein [Motilimonas sp. 1_MG-2023]